MTSTGDALLLAQDIHVSIDGEPLVNAFNLTLHENELIGLVGPNGAGKSTLLNVMTGLRKPDSGNVSVLGKSLDQLKANERAQAISWLEQQGHVHWPISVHRLVGLGRLPHRQGFRPRDENIGDAIQDAMAQTDCAHLAQRQFNTLSGGEQARALMARALAANPTVLLADEPVASLDPGHQLQTMSLLRRFAKNGKGCVAVLHDLSLAMRYCDQVYLMSAGRLVEHGAPEIVLSDENLENVYGVKAIRGEHPVPWILPYE